MSLSAKINDLTVRVAAQFKSVAAKVEAVTSTANNTKTTVEGLGSVYATKTELGNDSFIGKIEMFYGTLDSTGKHPLVGNVKKTNWQVCDGTNGTPDLRDKFVIGAGSNYVKGATGGSSSLVSVDKTSFDYSMSTSSVETPQNIATSLPPYVALYYVMKIA